MCRHSRWRRKWQSTPVFLPGKSHGQTRLAGYSPWGCKEHDWACPHADIAGERHWLMLRSVEVKQRLWSRSPISGCLFWFCYLGTLTFEWKSCSLLVLDSPSLKWVWWQMIGIIPLPDPRSKWNNKYKCVKLHRQKTTFLGLSHTILKALGKSWDSGICMKWTVVWKIIDLGGPSHLRKIGLEEGNQFSSLSLGCRSLSSSILLKVLWKLRIHWALIGGCNLFGPVSTRLDKMKLSWSN